MFVKKGRFIGKIFVSIDACFEQKSFWENVAGSGFWLNPCEFFALEIFEIANAAVLAGYDDATVVASQAMSILPSIKRFIISV